MLGVAKGAACAVGLALCGSAACAAQLARGLLNTPEAKGGGGRVEEPSGLGRFCGVRAPETGEGGGGGGVFLGGGGWPF